MITLKDLNTRDARLGDEEKTNLENLATKLNLLEERFGEALKITNGFRAKDHHIEIYSRINARRAKQKLNAISIPWGSQHLYGRAADISDPNRKLQAFLLSDEGLQLLQELDLYCEDFAFTENWTHLQSVPPKSGKRFFKP